MTTAVATPIPEISTLLDDFLVAKNKAEGGRSITGNATWRASKLGSCLKAQYLEFFLKQPKLEEFSALTLRRFEVGNQWGRQFARWFREMGYGVEEEVELHDEDLDVGAHGDFILTSQRGNKVGIELKSMNSMYFWYRAREKETVASPEHMMQTATYDILARKQGLEIPWLVLCVSKDDLTMNQDLVTEAHRERALDRLNTLNLAVATGKIPPCTCTDPEGNYNGNEWKYCCYWPGKPENKKRKGAKPDAGVACCEVAA